MKSIILLASLLIGSISFAQSAVIITPQRPLNCDQRMQNHRYINWIYNLQKTQESEDQVSIRFVTSHGSCISGQRSVRNIIGKYAMVSLLQDKIVLFQKQPYTVKVTPVSAQEVQVDMVFNKKRLFKKDSERSFVMSFMPGEMVPVQNMFTGRTYIVQLSFQWDIDVLQKADRMTDIKLGSIGVP